MSAEGAPGTIRRSQSPTPSHPTRLLWWRAAAYWFVLSRAWWRSLVARSVLEPLLYLVGLGFGLGTLVDAGGDAPGGVPYAAYVAPGVLVASAMQSGFGESAWPVLGAIKWQRQYHAQLASPLRVRDVLVGHMVFIAVRLAVTIVPFFAVMAALGLVAWPWAPLAVLVGLLTGTAFALPIAAYSATVSNDTSFALLLRFALIPMFLFAGVFFPVADLPGLLQPVVWLTPLWHGVELARAATLGLAPAPLVVAGHVAYLVAWVVAGLLVALRTYTRRLT
ncbi:ABC transporter permease [Aquipuribacter nitratireducens]|uniref:Transport permease protein n=1 Tax=Aquipuribacter nitratireducens TaxID=650104 RepID=A0ABW0GIZ8_9MICO